MKHLILVAATCVALGAPVGSAPAQEPGAKSPPNLNVLLIISDDLRTELGCYGSPLAQTPNIDALAAAGVRFDRAYCQFPLCNPSRTSMLTSRYPVSTGVLDNRQWFAARHPEFISLPQWFKQHGYATLRTGKIFHGGIDDTDAWTEGGEPRRFGAAMRGGASVMAQQTAPAQGTPRRPRGNNSRRPLTKAQRSDRWLVLPGEGERNGDYRNAQRAAAYLREYANRNEPFFLAVGFSKPHSPLEAPQSCYDLYKLDSVELPPDFAPRPTVPAGFPRQSIRPRNADLFIGRDATPEAAREMIRAYLASVSFVDANVGRVIAELDRLGLRDNTVIVFWGDHGYQLGEKGKWSKAGSLWEQGCRTPLIIAAPHAAGHGQASPRTVQAIDIYPTLAELCGLPLPPGIEGRSLAPLLRDPQAVWDHPAFTIWSENGRTPTGVAVRTGRWRYAEFDDGREAMLLDEAADPHEMTNVADNPDHAAIRERLSALVRQHVERTGSSAVPAP
jgi:arylsulfatase A-like enzyme